MDNQLEKLNILQKKQDLILKLYLDLVELKKERRNYNNLIKEKEEKLSRLIQSKPEEEPNLFSQL